MKTIATLFSGGELVGVGARQAGYNHLWGCELDDSIASVARLNGFNTITADVLTLDPNTLPIPDLLHASPVCTRASVANQSAETNEDGLKESPLDIAMGEKVAQFIDVMTPKYVTIENVYQYRKFKAFKIICAALNRNGYMWDFDNLNSADYGVPQTRRRLILRASRAGLLPNLPQPVKWVGWYEAIEDLIPDLPESQFAKWQLERLPEGIKSFVISSNISASTSYSHEPIDTITSDNGSRYRAFILAQGKYGNDLVKSDKSQPVFTITANSNQSGLKAFIVDGQNSGSDGSNRLIMIRNHNEPMFGVTSTAIPKGTPKAWLSQGRVVKMTVRCLGRFQSVPDDYKGLTAKIAGNGVPCLLYQRLLELF